MDFSEGIIILNGLFTCQLYEKTFFTPDRCLPDFSSFLVCRSPTSSLNGYTFKEKFKKKKQESRSMDLYKTQLAVK